MRTSTALAAALAGSWLAIAGASAALAQAALETGNPIEGAIDFHVHSAPDAFARNISDIDVAEFAARRGMRAIVLKNHITMTADRAALVAEVVPGIDVYGGVVLNHAVGGLNPAAVEVMATMSGGHGRVVWLPTRDAQHDIATFNKPGEGIRVADNGQVTSEMDAVLDKIREHDLVLHTGHVSPEEIMAVIRRAKELGIDKIAVTHAMADVPGMSIEQMKQAAAEGALLELVFLNHLMGPNAHLDWMHEWSQVSIAEMAAAIKEVGADHFILASDLGQTGNPIHPDGYEMMVRGLEAEGIPTADINKMMSDNPARLLGLDTKR
jgi:microsomal dipeptidase-like Zn-dependent dipeptidase